MKLFLIDVSDSEVNWNYTVHFDEVYIQLRLLLYRHSKRFSGSVFIPIGDKDACLLVHFTEKCSHIRLLDQVTDIYSRSAYSYTQLHHMYPQS